MDLGIAEKVAIVAAGSKGLGRAIAARLATDGARVAICARNAEPLEQAARQIAAECGAEVLPIAADVSKPEDCQRFVAAAVERRGAGDILVNNSGGPAPGTFDMTGDAAWDAGVQSTLMNVVRLIRLVVPQMTARGWGRIVNVTSISVKQPIPELLLSNSIRAAVIGLAKTLATELAPLGILVINVCPGLHETDRLRELAQARAMTAGTTAELEVQRMAETIPIGRLGQPQELADVVAFLCSARAG